MVLMAILLVYAMRIEHILVLLMIACRDINE